MHPKQNKINYINKFTNKKSVFGIFLLTLATILLLPAAAQAREVNVTVVNERGIPQSGVKVYYASTSGAPLAQTNGMGEALLDTDSGVSYRFTRNNNTSGNCLSPEGEEGIVSQVGEDNNMTVTLPNSNGENFAPELSNNERWLIGKINDYRAEYSLPPLYLSNTLNDSADRYGQYWNSEYSSVTGEEAHCLIGNILVRSVDAGWPSAGRLGENLSTRGQDPREVFAGWVASSGHNHTMLSPEFGAVGIAQVGGKWVLNLAPAVDSSSVGYERTQMTEDIGDSSLEIDIPEPPPIVRENANMFFTKALSKKNKVRAFVKIDRQAKGRIVAKARKGGKTKRVRVQRKGGVVKLVTKLKKGNWKIDVRFQGSSKWKKDKAKARVKIKKHGAKNWKKLPKKFS